MIIVTYPRRSKVPQRKDKDRSWFRKEEEKAHRGEASLRRARAWITYAKAENLQTRTLSFSSNGAVLLSGSRLADILAPDFK